MLQKRGLHTRREILRCTVYVVAYTIHIVQFSIRDLEGGHWEATVTVSLDWGAYRTLASTMSWPQIPHSLSQGGKGQQMTVRTTRKTPQPTQGAKQKAGIRIKKKASKKKLTWKRGKKGKEGRTQGRKARKARNEGRKEERCFIGKQ